MRLVIAAIVSSLVACAAGPQAIRRNSMLQIDPAQRDTAFSRALSVVQSGGWLIAVSDRAGGLLTTQPMDSGARSCGGMMSCGSRTALQVTIAETGTLTVNLHREFFRHGVSSPGYWFVPTDEEVVRAIEAEQDRILATIAGTAGPR